MGGGITPSPWKELELHENGESYEKQILGMWIYFSCDVFHEKSLKKSRALRAQSRFWVTV